MLKKPQTDFLFAQPSFSSGAARVLDLWGSFDGYNESSSAEEADQIAISNDWAVVGQDIYNALGLFETQVEHEREHVA
jgi:hypothetical protein